MLKKRRVESGWGGGRRVDVAKAHNTIISKSTPCLVPDEQVLSRLLTVSAATTRSGVRLQAQDLEVEQVCILNNATIRKYFQSLTERFLAPFQEYFTFKVAAGVWNPYLKPPALKPFEVWCRSLFVGPRSLSLYFSAHFVAAAMV